MKVRFENDGAVLSVTYQELALLKLALVAERVDEQNSLELLADFPDFVAVAKQNIDMIDKMLEALR